MRNYIASGSSIGLGLKCAPSHALPWVKRLGVKADIGSALHQHIFERNPGVLGVQAAMERLPQVAEQFGLDDKEARIFMARARGFEWIPPKGTISEVALCLMEDGTVERVQGGQGNYQAREGSVLPMTIDAMWSEPEPLRVENGRIVCPEGSTLWVIDLKSGEDRYTDPIERNAQAISGAVLGAKYTGAALVMPAILYVRNGPGIWDTPTAPMNAEGLAGAERFILDGLERIKDARANLSKSLPMAFVEGPHCTYCDAQTYCAAKTATLRAFLGDPSPATIATLAPDQLARLAALLPSIDGFAKKARDALQAHVEATGEPIAIGDGKVWGPFPKTKQLMDPAIAFSALAAEVGEDKANDAIVVYTTRDKIEDAVRESHKDRGIKRQKKAAMGRIMGAIAKNNGFRVVHETWWSAHYPAPVVEDDAKPVAQLTGDIEIEGDLD